MAINPSELAPPRFVRATATHIPTWSIAFENRTVGHPATGAHYVETIYRLVINGVAEEDDYGSYDAAECAAYELGLPGAALPRHRQASPAGEQGWRQNGTCDCTPKTCKCAMPDSLRAELQDWQHGIDTDDDTPMYDDECGPNSYPPGMF